MTRSFFIEAEAMYEGEEVAEDEKALKKRGGALVYRNGPIIEILQKLHEEVHIDHLWSHEETGNNATYPRDVAVAQWAKAKGVSWTEIPQFGVFRPLKDRDGWARRWDERIKEGRVKAPEVLHAVKEVSPEAPRAHADLGLEKIRKLEALVGGFSLAQEVLESFLAHRGMNYQKEMSSPVTAWEDRTEVLWTPMFHVQHRLSGGVFAPPVRPTSA